jgi:two-component system NarL family response regulator
MEKPRFKMPFRVLTVSANTLIHAGVRRLLEKEAELVQVGEATSTSQALAAYSQLNPDLILIDRKLPAAGCLAIVTTLRAQGTSSRLLVLDSGSPFEDPSFLDTPALPAVRMENPAPYLLGRMRGVARGIEFQPPDLQRPGEPGILTRAELRVLKQLAVGFSNKEIAAAIGSADGTVKYHIKNILSKLRVRDRTAAVVMALRRGIIDIRALDP